MAEERIVKAYKAYNLVVQLKESEEPMFDTGEFKDKIVVSKMILDQLYALVLGKNFAYQEHQEKKGFFTK